jgi:nicotinic acid mononucleotide adenylyltransferase
MVVIEFAGAGSQALAWLHAIGGSSRTILEATDHYSADSLVEAIGFEPAQYASVPVVKALATRAHIRAGHLANIGTPVVGVACSATIATDYAKRGQHRCCLAVSDTQGITTYNLTLTKGRRTRLEEENLVSLLILRAVARVCGVPGLPEVTLASTEELVERFEPAPLPARVLTGALDWTAVMPDGTMKVGQTWPNLALLSGAFNPLHTGHRQLAHRAADILGQAVYFELPLINADKGTITLAETNRRMAQFAGEAPLILTRAPLFSQKARLFPRSVFVLGVDTVQRLIQPRFYNDSPAEMLASFATVKEAGCRFLVAGRKTEDQFVTLQDIALPEGYQDLFTAIPSEEFRIDISSTAIREKQNARSRN